MAQAVSITPGAPPPPVTPASQPGGAVAPTAPQIAGQAASYNGAPLPSFSAAMQPDAALTPAQTGYDDPTKSKFTQMMTRNVVNPGDEYSRTLANGPGAFDYFADFFHTPDKTSGPSLDQKAAQARFYADPMVRKYVTSDRNLMNAAQRDPGGFMSALNPVMSMARNPLPNSANGKAVGDPQALADISARTGEHPDVAHLFHEPHKYSEDEFVQRAAGLSWNQAAKLWGMQHYQSPDQMVFTQLMSGVQAQADAAGKLYSSLVNSGAPQGKIDEAKASWQALRAKGVDLLTKKALGQVSIYPNSQSGE